LKETPTTRSLTQSGRFNRNRSSEVRSWRGCDLGFLIQSGLSSPYRPSQMRQSPTPARQDSAGGSVVTDTPTHVSVAPDPVPSPGLGDSGRELSEAYLDYASAVYRHACRAALGDHQAAEDVTQQAFVEAFRNWPEFRQLPPGQQCAWLCARARWRIIDSWHATWTVTAGPAPAS